MKIFLTGVASLSLLAGHALGQGAQADQIKRRAKELSNQNNVRQGVPTPAPPRAYPAPTAARPATATPAATPQQGVAKIQAAIAGLKLGSPATAEQKQQFIKDIASACRGTKPSLPAVTAFVNEVTVALTEQTLEAVQQSRLAQDIEAVLNSTTMPLSQFDAIIADVQAIFQVGGAKRNQAASAANNLKAVGLEVRKGSAR
ncbi:MAG: hypothetical protein MUF81_08375 [Verrucomicrobia bacterium]|jgi:hypothetical protein|nr:hypothetical protein [Verrucomicrobiota bacterium]